MVAAGQIRHVYSLGHLFGAGRHLPRHEEHEAWRRVDHDATTAFPSPDYTEFAKQFDPTNFNADQWVKLAKAAGMKYIVITAKHHDGFAMFHTHGDVRHRLDATPWHRDPLAELAAACRKEGIRLGFYYSQAQDWNHPGGAAAGSKTGQDVDRQNHWDPAQQGSMDDFIEEVDGPADQGVAFRLRAGCSVLVRHAGGHEHRNARKNFFRC